MRARARSVVGSLGGAAVFLLLAWPSFRVHLLCMRELYRLGELTGVMDGSAGLGGQVMGYNFLREPAWAHWVAGAVAAAAGFGPAVALSFWVVHRVRGTWRATLCGRCGAVIDGAREPRCPSCGGAF